MTRKRTKIEKIDITKPYITPKRPRATGITTNRLPDLRCPDRNANIKFGKPTRKKA